MLAGDGVPLSVVGPWCKHEKQTLGAGIKVLPGWLVKRRKAVLQDNDEWMLSIQSSAGDLFLTGRNTWAHHHSTLVSSMQEVFLLFGNKLEVRLGVVVVAADLHSHRVLQEPVIADGGKGVTTKVQLTHDAKQVGMLSLDHGAQRVLLYVADHICKLSFTHEHGVVVTRGEERGTFRSLAVRKRAGIRHSGSGYGGRNGRGCCARRIIIRRTERSG